MEPFKKGTVVAVFAFRKTCAYAIGIAEMSNEKILKTGQGVAVTVLHRLNDGIWALQNKISHTNEIHEL
jgi:predicted ribosome-associated RNA-binding protein Tma20